MLWAFHESLVTHIVFVSVFKPGIVWLLKRLVLLAVSRWPFGHIGGTPERGQIG